MTQRGYAVPSLPGGKVRGNETHGIVNAVRQQAQPFYSLDFYHNIYLLSPVFTKIFTFLAYNVRDDIFSDTILPCAAVSCLFVVALK